MRRSAIAEGDLKPSDPRRVLRFTRICSGLSATRYLPRPQAFSDALFESRRLRRNKDLKEGAPVKVRGFENLRRLQLDRTAITGTGLRALSGLSHLETLNLHGTSTSDADLSALESLPRLRSLYLWQTQVSAEAATRLGQKQTDHRRIARWRAEMAALEAKIRAETFRANLGTDAESRPPSPPAPTTARSP